MRKTILPLGALLLGIATLAPKAAHAAPRQAIVIVAEGLSPQVIDLGRAYLRKADGQPDENTAFDDFKTAGKALAADGNTLTSLRGLLKTAAANGYKTGLVTTGDVTAVAPIFYDINGDAAGVAESLATGTKFDIVAGGGRSHFDAALKQKLTAAGGAALFAADTLDQETKGKVLALQSDGEATYSIDREPDQEAGLGDLTSLAIDTLSANGAPFVLVVHDTLIAKALAAKDTPALVEQFREVNTIVTDALGRRDDNPGLGVALLATGDGNAPKFTTDNASDRSNALFILSNLSMSYAKAGTTLKGADDAKLDEFAAEEYKGWKLSTENRAALRAGTLAPEAAIRASYEAALKISYEPGNAPAWAYAAGFDGAGDLTQTLHALVASKPSPAKPVKP